jgi:hypothetical protein
MKMIFKLKKVKGDLDNDQRYPFASPNPIGWDIACNHIFNDEACYWWVTESDITPQLGWLIYPPVKPF